jgi:hypothetical protein
MKPILALNAFDMNNAATLSGALELQVRQRSRPPPQVAKTAARRT